MNPTEAATVEEPAQGHQPGLSTPQMRRILASSFLGGAIEFYDFMLYATASALVFPHVFFTDLSPGVAAFASFGTLAAGYVARPLGGAIFGHFGDRVGRKNALVISMFIMGAATTLIGLLPSSSQIGSTAVVLLITCRVLQGIAVGGEWGGAMLIALEHAPGGKRGFAASFASMGAPAGSILATAVLTAATFMPDEQFLSWGWRIPFLLSLVLVTIGLFVRLKVAESPLFIRFEEEAEKRRLPVVEVLTRYPKRLALGTIVGVSQLTISGMASVWAVNYVVSHGADRTGVLNTKTLAAVMMLLTTFLAARMCDRFGRKPILIAGIAAAILFVYPMLYLVHQASVASFAIALVIGQGIQGIILGPLSAFLAELFPTSVRFTGSSLCFQGASALGAGFTPMAAAGLVSAAGGAFTLLGGVWIGVLAVCLLATLRVAEGQRKDLAVID
ncbi:MFS transporter [Streptomyces sp. NPDC056390]|uniref:MFS transporter n=1 Tax=Streptomyces sp. NPDC056390 TaxID=3345806 RepID=UPI0035D9EE81